MSFQKKGNKLVPDSPDQFPVPEGDPIGIEGSDMIHCVACYVQGDRNEDNIVTICGIETGRYRHNYPSKGTPCPKCWPKGICCSIDKPRLLVDNTEYHKRNPF